MMSDPNFPCPRCGLPYYGEHASWCVALRELEERVYELEAEVAELQRSQRD